MRIKSDKKKEIELEKAGVGKFDYECRDAKFIVGNVPRFGLGASISKGAADVLMMGVASNRVALLLNSIESGTRTFIRPWPLASCDRHDMQCVFMPMSPCVVTKEDVKNAPYLSDKERDELRESNWLDEKYDNEKVIMIGTSTNMAKAVPNAFREAVAESVSDLFDNIEEEKKNKNVDIYSKPIWDMDAKTLERVKENILDESLDIWRLHHVAIFYILRLNLQYQKKMEEMMSEILPEDFRPESAIGIPIRGEFRYFAFFV